METLEFPSGFERDSLVNPTGSPVRITRPDHLLSCFKPVLEFGSKGFGSADETETEKEPNKKERWSGGVRWSGVCWSGGVRWLGEVRGGSGVKGDLCSTQQSSHNPE